jgi:hypothetical protein
MKRFPETDILGVAAAYAALCFLFYLMVRIAIAIWTGIPVLHAMLWPGWAVGLVAAYAGSVIVRALR